MKQKLGEVNEVLSQRLKKGSITDEELVEMMQEMESDIRLVRLALAQRMGGGDELLSLEEQCELLEISHSELGELSKGRDFPAAVMVGRNSYRRRSDLEKWRAKAARNE